MITGVQAARMSVFGFLFYLFFIDKKQKGF